MILREPQFVNWYNISRKRRCNCQNNQLKKCIVHVSVTNHIKKLICIRCICLESRKSYQAEFSWWRKAGQNQLQKSSTAGDLPPWGRQRTLTSEEERWFVPHFRSTCRGIWGMPDRRATRLGPRVTFVIGTQRDLREYLLNVHVQSVASFFTSCPNISQDEATDSGHGCGQRDLLQSRHFVKFGSAILESN